MGHPLGSTMGETSGELIRDVLLFLGKGGDMKGVSGEPILCVRRGEGRIGLTFVPMEGEANEFSVRSDAGLKSLLQSERSSHTV